MTPRGRVLVTGGGGQLGGQFAHIEFRDTEVVVLERSECDIENRDQVRAVLERIRPQAVINAAAYSAVDSAESEPDRADAVNRRGVQNLAEIATYRGTRVVHVSTDYVFDGTATTPYEPEATPNPLGVYGQSKLAGERAVLASGANALVVRTAWLYSDRGRNFLTRILGMIRSGQDLRIVSDQFGTPTSALELARVLLHCALDRSLTGVAHWTNAGSTTWYDFATAIQSVASAAGELRSEVRIVPITTQEYPTAAHRPRYSVLDCSRLYRIFGAASHWRADLERVITALKTT